MPPRIHQDNRAAVHAGSRRRPLVAVTLIAVVLVTGVVGFNYAINFKGEILGFFRVGTELRHSPYLDVPASVLAEGELGYDGQLYLSIALDPLLRNPDTIAALDNPRFRYRRILYPLLTYVLSLGQRPAIPYVAVAVNAVSFVGLIAVLSQFLTHRRRGGWLGLLGLGIPGAWMALLLSTVDLVGGLLLVAATGAALRDRPGRAAALMGAACLTHETMLLVLAAFLGNALLQKDRTGVLLYVSASVPAVLWNVFVLWYLPAAGSTSGMVEAFSAPFLGLAAKLNLITTSPMSLKWMFDAASLFLLVAGFVLLGLSTAGDRDLRLLCLCGGVYFALFALAKLQILGYYIDFNRVFMNVTFLLIMSLAGRPWYRSKRVVLAGWCALAAGWATAYSMGLI